MKRILLVDDEPDIRRIAEIALCALGAVEILTAASGEEALARVEQNPPDLVLLDVMMPGLGGLLTLQRLKTQTTSAHIPVVMMTARASRAEQARYLALGATEVVVKPFDLPGLTGRVTRLLDVATAGDPPAPAQAKRDPVAPLAQLRADFVSRLPSQLDQLVQLVAAAAHAPISSDAEPARAAAAVAHRLRGTAGSYGLTDFADEMSSVETLLTARSGNDWETIRQCLRAARSAIPDVGCLPPT